MATRNVPYWLDRVPKTRRPAFPRLRGAFDTSVVIVGGGLTGCACAWSFAAAGVKVILLEADTIGSGATARGLGLVREDFDASFQETASAHGLRAARSLWQSMRRASLDFPAALRRLAVKCDLAPEDLLTCSSRDPQSSRLLRREYQSRRDAGLNHTWLTPAAVTREAAIESGGAIRTRGFALDPYRACLGLVLRRLARGDDLRAVRSRGSGQAGKQVESRLPRQRSCGSGVGSHRGAESDSRTRRHLKTDSYAVVTESLPAAVRPKSAAGRTPPRR